MKYLIPSILALVIFFNNCNAMTLQELQDNAKAGDAQAQYDLSLRFFDGDGVKKNPKSAVQLLEMAANQGHKDAIFKVGLCYDKGIGCLRNPKTAHDYLLISANDGKKEAQEIIAKYYLNGAGPSIKKDKETANYWLLKVAAQDSKPNYEKLNTLMGVKLFGAKDFWDESASDFIFRLSRLGFKFEKTQTNDSCIYSSYTSKSIFKVKSEQIKVLTKNNKVESVQIIFFNKGDSYETGHNISSSDVLAVRKNSKEISDSLTEIFKTSKGVTRNEGFRELGKLWTDNYLFFTLINKKNEYLSLYIESPKIEEDTKKSSQASLRKQIKTNIIKNDKGDVYIESLPMINQGSKGYCAPATYERCLLYYGIQGVDMHKIAAILNTSVGGGTVVNDSSTSSFFKTYRLKYKSINLSLSNIKRYIDAGEIICFTHYYVPELRIRITQNAQIRKTNDENWHEQIKCLPKLKDAQIKTVPQLKSLTKSKTTSNNTYSSHICNIVGYNQKSQEVALSNSWGSRYQVEWVRIRDLEEIVISTFVVSP